MHTATPTYTLGEHIEAPLRKRDGQQKGGKGVSPFPVVPE